MSNLPLSKIAETVARPLVLLAGGVPESAAALLTEAGCEVRGAPSAAALRRLANGTPPPQLILLGDAEAEEPGLSLLSRLQDDDETRGIPVLFVAGDGSGADEELALALGAADCVSLPLRPLVLLARVHAQLRLQRLRQLERHAGEVTA